MLTPRTIAAIAVVGLASWVPVAAGAQSDTEAERGEVQERRSEVADEIDVLSATDAEIGAVLDGIDAQLATQEGLVAEAEAASAAAAAAVREAEADLRTARRDVAILEDAIREMAVASFIHPPSVDLVESLSAASLSDAILQKAYLDARAKRDGRLLDLLSTAEAEAERRAAEVAVAAEEAEAAVAAAEEALVSLRDEQARQRSFAADLQDRIDSRLAEAAVLADLDAELADKIAAEQAALIERIPPPPEPDPIVATSSTPPAQTPGTTTTTPPGSPTTTSPPTTTPPPPPSGNTPPLRTVQGITVHADIADDVDALLTAAKADGIALSGWGYRSTERQIELRRANCGPTYYDIWIRPASSCSPPTAVPGRSLHEQGRAIDFTQNGSTITSRSSSGFQWLAANASSYGLFNLPSEPWHWSTNGG
ncbi:D-alanyl-D-alanine carboxypeptidase family protein [Actinospongicola halichondriae]|uniref:D-alanyl-D-alanine carboxypeptidase family protein n=1 Tax=Actinospongicola halichondriae TaxID=3236844 RepID=UPI003D5CD8F8